MQSGLFCPVFKTCFVAWRAVWLRAPAQSSQLKNEEMASFMEGTSEEKMPLLEEGKADAANEAAKENEEVAEVGPRAWNQLCTVRVLQFSKA